MPREPQYWQDRCPQCGEPKSKQSSLCRDCKFPPVVVQQPDDLSIKHIPLTRGQFSIVDAVDYQWLSQYKWQALAVKNGFYATRSEKVDGKTMTLLMHREILGLGRGDSSMGEHADRNTLNNRRSNLRPATNGQNQCNRKVLSTSRSGLKGAHLDPRKGKYAAHIRINGKQTHLGYFPTAELAHAAYCQAAQQHFGEFARSA